MAQDQSPWGNAPTEPYYGQHLTENEASWGSSSNPTLPPLRTGATGDVFMGAVSSHGYGDENQDFFEAIEYNTSGTAQYDRPFASNSGASWPSLVDQGPLQLPINSIHDQTLGHFDVSTAMSDPNYFGSIAALTDEVTRDVEMPGSLQLTEPNIDFSYHGPAIATDASIRPCGAGSDKGGNDADSLSDLGENMADTIAEHGGFQSALVQDNSTEISPGMVLDGSSLKATPRIPSPSTIETRAIARPRKSRGRKPANESPTAAEQVFPVFPEPDETYDFAVTDKDDVFLDPKPVADFGTHEVHLVKKISDATRDLKERDSQASQILSTPGQQQVLWHPPASDHSIPTTPAHYEICFDLLVKAIDYSGEDVVEKRDSKEFQRRWIDREHYDPGFVQDLAKLVLDTMIDVHRNGWTYYVHDPAFRLLYHKTMYFTFRDRFNVTALVLKYSKTTCDGILKGQRLFDVIGNSYNLETRVTSNKKANSDRAFRLAKNKKEEAAGQTVTKRALDANEEEEPDNQTSGLKKPRKRAKVPGGAHLPAEEPDTAPPESAAEPSTNAVAKVPGSRAKTASSVSRGSAKTSKKHSIKTAASKSPVLDDDSPQSDSAEIALEDGTVTSHTAGLPAQDSRDGPPKRKTSKRGLSQIHEQDEHDEEDPVVPPAKKAKPTARKTARPKNPSAKAPAKSKGTG